MTGYRRPRRASTKALAIGVVVYALWFVWAYRDAIGVQLQSFVTGGWL